MWVRSEYANELAVLSAWVALLIPWNVASHSQFITTPLGDGDAGMLFFRFPLFELQFRDSTIVPDTAAETGPTAGIEISDNLAELYPGTKLFGDLFVTVPPNSASFYESTLQLASLLGSLAWLGFVTALVLSVSLYVREERVAELLPVSPVHLMGGLLGVGALGAAGATVLYYTQRDVVGFPIPVGVLIIGLLAVMLLRTEEVSDDEDEGRSLGPES